MGEARIRKHQMKETPPPKYNSLPKHKKTPGLHSPFLLTRLVHFLTAIWHNLSPPLTFGPRFLQMTDIGYPAAADAACSATNEQTLPLKKRRSYSPGHTFRDRGLTHLDTELEEFAMDPGPTQSGLARLMSRISWRISSGTFGLPPRERDFHRQNRRKLARCQPSPA